MRLLSDEHTKPVNFLVSLLGLPLLVAALWLSADALALDTSQDGDDKVAGKTAAEWVRSMVGATRATHYKGKLIFHQDGLASARFMVERGQIDGKPFERLLYLEEPVREMVRHGDVVTFKVRKGDDFVDTVGSFVPTFFDSEFSELFANLPVNYSAVFAGHKKIAKRKALGIHVVPKDMHRYGYRLWLDLDSALMLSFEMLDTRKKSLESFRFETLTLNAELTNETARESIRHDQIVMQVRPPRRSLTPSPEVGTVYKNWKFGWLPDGFTLISRRSKETIVPGGSSELHSLVYSDGLAVFSIFIEKLQDVHAKAQTGSLGATTTAVRWARGAANTSHMVTLIGEIPEPTALRIAEKISYKASK